MKVIPSHFTDALRYIQRAGKLNFISQTYYCLVSDFVEDHEPIGKVLINQLVHANLVEIDDETFLRIL